MENMADSHLRSLAVRINEVKSEFMTVFDSFVSRQSAVLQQLLNEQSSQERWLTAELSGVRQRTSSLLSAAKTNLEAIQTGRDPQLAAIHQDNLKEIFQRILREISDARTHLHGAQLDSTRRYELLVRDERDLISDFTKRSADTKRIADGQLLAVKHDFSHQMTAVSLAAKEKLNRKVKAAELNLADGKLDHTAHLYQVKSRFQRNLSALESLHQSDLSELQTDRLELLKQLESQLSQINFNSDAKRLGLTADIRLSDQSIAELLEELKNLRQPKTQSPSALLQTDKTLRSTPNIAMAPSVAQLQRQISQLELHLQQVKFAERKKFADLREFLQSQRAERLIMLASKKSTPLNEGSSDLLH